jgi:hypothetical protein
LLKYFYTDALEAACDAALEILAAMSFFEDPVLKSR